MPPFSYNVYGLIFASELELPELLPAHGTPDVRIRYGTVAETLDNPRGRGGRYQTKANQLLLHLDEVARYQVQNGSEIIIDRVPGALDSDVRTFLFGSCLGALLHQRGFLALHASAIQTERGAVLFAGKSGVGKSALLSAFLTRGYQMLADDISGIQLDADSVPVVQPAFPQVKLWADTLTHLNQSSHGLRRVRPQLEKFARPITNSFVSRPVPLAAVYILSAHNQTDIQLEPVDYVDRFALLLRHTYRHRYLEGLELRQPHFALATTAAKVATVKRVIRPSRPFLLDALAGRLEEDFCVTDSS